MTGPFPKRNGQKQQGYVVLLGHFKDFQISLPFYKLFVTNLNLSILKDKL